VSDFSAKIIKIYRKVCFLFSKLPQCLDSTFVLKYACSKFSLFTVLQQRSTGEHSQWMAHLKQRGICRCYDEPCHRNTHKHTDTHAYPSNTHRLTHVLFPHTKYIFIEICVILMKIYRGLYTRNLWHFVTSLHSAEWKHLS
jgi:hypothetical protein